MAWLLVEGFKLFKIIFIDRKNSKIISNLGTIMLSVFVVFIFLESIFMFIPRSHGVHYSLAAQLWLAKYWKPVNSLGFKDKEPQHAKNAILFLGDSFTAGHGLKYVEERFSNIVEKELNKDGAQYTTINIGANDADTTLEYNRMIDFYYLTRIKPKTIVLQYFANDIERVAMNNGIVFEGFRPPPDMNKFLLFIGSGSYFINYIYWLFPREYLSLPYINFLKQSYENKDVLAKHKENLRAFIDYARDNSIQLIVVIFPFMNDLGMSDSMYVKDIANLFEASNISTINVSPLVKDIPVNERIININDAHASPKVHRIVAREILKKIDQQN
jgi:hypothetical protein